MLNDSGVNALRLSSVAAYFCRLAFYVFSFFSVFQLLCTSLSNTSLSHQLFFFFSGVTGLFSRNCRFFSFRTNAAVSSPYRGC